jgi:hypothetical protein
MPSRPWGFAWGTRRRTFATRDAVVAEASERVLSMARYGTGGRYSVVVRNRDTGESLRVTADVMREPPVLVEEGG